MKRCDFLKTTAMGTGMIALGSRSDVFSLPDYQIKKNNLPRWRGFNILDFFSPNRYVSNIERLRATEQDFKWMADWGFDFVRIPMAYPSYLNYDPVVGRDIYPEETVDFREEAIEGIEKIVHAANKYNLHVSLNLHRAPGFCINAGFHEPFNLWKDDEAQQAFYQHWDMWAKRFKNVSPKLLSFDLVNEPCFKEDMNDQFAPSTAIPGDIYRKVAKGCLDAIHRQNADRIVVADGNHGGSLVIPELVDLPIGQSCRGYYPHYVSHYRAGWVWKNPDDAPLPVWPGVIDVPKREYIASMRDRRDETVDRIRTIRTDKFRYIRNFYPELPYSQWNSYKKFNYPVLTLMQVMLKNGELTEEQALFFAETRPEEELYDIQKDPYCLNNLADNISFEKELSMMQDIMDNWLKKYDLATYPEAEEEVEYAKEFMDEQYKSWLSKEGLNHDISDEDFLKWWEEKLQIDFNKQ